MQETRRFYKGFHIVLFVPEDMELGTTSGYVHILSSGADVGVRLTPDWPEFPTTSQESQAQLFAYASGIIDCEHAGGFGIDLSTESVQA
ncbi:hypothetical protein [Cupriavidus necator]